LNCLFFHSPRLTGSPSVHLSFVLMSQDEFFRASNFPINKNASVEWKKHIFSFEDQILEETENVRVAQIQRMKNAKDFCKNSSQILPTKKKSKVVLVTDPEQRLAYCHVPKVASSAWMIIFSDLNRLPTKLHLFEKDISINDSLSRKKKLRNFRICSENSLSGKKN